MKILSLVIKQFDLEKKPVIPKRTVNTIDLARHRPGASLRKSDSAESGMYIRSSSNTSLASMYFFNVTSALNGLNSSENGKT